MESVTVPTATPPLSGSPDIDRKTARLVLALLMAVFALLLIFKMDAVAGGADSSGYLNHAKQIAKGHIFEPMRIVGDLRPSTDPELTSYLYVPLGYRPAGGPEEMAATYPVGLPLLLAAIAAIVGWNATAGITIALHAMAGVLILYALARNLGLSRHWSLVGILLAGLCPLYLIYSLQLMSDLPSFTWCAATILLAWLSRDRPSLALAAGVSFAIAVLIRPSNALLIFAIAVAFGFSWRSWLLFGLAGLPGAFFWAAYNRAAYGHPLASGYGNIFEIMGAQYGLPTLLHYLRWLPALLTPLAVLLLAFPRLLASRPRIGWMLFLWWSSFAIFYAFYYCTHETWWYMRFLLPAFPAFILTILLVAAEISAHYRVDPFNLRNRRSRIVTGVLLVAIVSSSIYWNRKLHTFHNQDDHLHYAKACAWARENLPANSILLAMQVSGALFFYTDFAVVRWDSASAENLEQLEAAARATGRPIYAATFPFEMDETPGANSLLNKFPGWEQLTRSGQTTLWKRVAAHATTAEP